MKRFSGLLAVALVAMLVPSAAAAADTPVTRTVHRSYGDGPVRLGKATYLKVQFDGRRGDQVRLGRTAGCLVSLRGPDGESIRRMPSGFWRLAVRGQHLFTLTRCDDLENSTQVLLEKARYVAVRSNAVEGAVLPSERGFVDAFRVRVPDTGRLQVKAVHRPGFGRDVVATVQRDGDWYTFGLGGTLFFEDGRPIAGPFGLVRAAGGSGALVARAGDKITFFAHGRQRAFVSVAQPVPIVVDAPATPINPSAVPYREYQLEFDGVAGDWVQAEVVGPLATDADYRPMLVGPGGHIYQNWRYGRLPATGRYRLMVPSVPTTESTQVRIRSIRVLDSPIPVDGTHVTSATSEPGQFVVAPMTLGSALYRLHAHASTASGDWTVVAFVNRDLKCPRSSLGCGDYSQGSVDPLRDQSEEFGGGTSGIVMLFPDPGVSASVELSISPTS